MLKPKQELINSTPEVRYLLPDHSYQILLAGDIFDYCYYSLTSCYPFMAYDSKKKLRKWNPSKLLAVAQIVAEEYKKTNLYLEKLKSISTKPQHACVLRYVSLEQKQNYLYIFHERIEITLEQLITQGQLTYCEKVSLALDMIAVLQQLAALGVCHRNLQPGNLVFVYIGPRDSNQKYKRLDNFYQVFRKQRDLLVLKLCQFHQSVLSDDTDRMYQPIKFYNPYTDPNISTFMQPQPCSDMWSLLLIFFDLLVNRRCQLGAPGWQEHCGLIKWQVQMFEYYYRGTVEVKMTLGDLHMRVKNMALTGPKVEELLREQQFRNQTQKDVFPRLMMIFIPKQG